MGSWHHHRFKGNVEIVGYCLENENEEDMHRFRTIFAQISHQVKFWANQAFALCLHAPG
ncbi:hypothetical protein A2U01_0058364, partial [Trifolium medium]|nr:hypothetical protein [Trifolium medium]